MDRVSFTVERGEFFSILGPSGAGKTSVLRMLAGFEEPDEGDLRIDGHPMLGVPPSGIEVADEYRARLGRLHPEALKGSREEATLAPGSALR